MTGAGPPSPEPERAHDTPDEGERFGPLVVRRLVKEDGRALIVYTRTDESDGDEA